MGLLFFIGNSFFYLIVFHLLLFRSKLIFITEQQWRKNDDDAYELQRLCVRCQTGIPFCEFSAFHHNQNVVCKIVQLDVSFVSWNCCATTDKLFQLFFSLSMQFSGSRGVKGKSLSSLLSVTQIIIIGFVCWLSLLNSKVFKILAVYENEWMVTGSCSYITCKCGCR